MLPEASIPEPDTPGGGERPDDEDWIGPGPAAARAAAGLTLKRHPATPVATNGNGHKPETARPRGRTTNTAGEREPLPVVDLAALAEQGIPTPELLCDGLLYRACLHSLAGAPDAGKSTLLYHWALLLTAQEQPVVILDEESGAEQVTEKLLALGATPEQLRRFTYIPFPARVWDASDRADLGQVLDEIRPALVGFDSASSFLARAGRDENQATDVTEIYNNLFLTIARNHHAAVVVLDHVTKDETAGRYARGNGAKLAAVDAAFRLEAKRPFSRAQSGLLTLDVTKDRRGYLARRHEVRVDVEDGAMALGVTPATGQPGHDPDPETGDLMPAARKLLEILRAVKDDPAGPYTIPELTDRLAERFGHGLKRQTASSALNELQRRGLADGERDDSHKGEKRWWAL